MDARNSVRRIVVTLAGVATVVLAGCVGRETDTMGKAQFTEELTRIAQTSSAEFGRLAEQVPAVDPASPLPDAFTTQMLAVAEADRQAAREIEGLAAPESAEAMVDSLAGALRARADVFERLAAVPNITLEQIEADEAGTDAERRLDEALAALTEAGFLRPPADEHDG